MEKFLQEVGARVKEARMRKHLSQAQLADLLGFTPPYISNIETGKQNMSITALAKISDIVNITSHHRKDYHIKKSADSLSYAWSQPANLAHCELFFSYPPLYNIYDMYKRGEHMSDDIKAKIRERYKGNVNANIEVIPAIEQPSFYEDFSEKRVAVYVRVSTGSANQTSSYELQKGYYEQDVTRHPGWKLVRIYADEGISGTSLSHRDEFVQMIKDCEAGKIDLTVSTECAGKRVKRSYYSSTLRMPRGTSTLHRSIRRMASPDTLRSLRMGQGRWQRSSRLRWSPARPAGQRTLGGRLPAVWFRLRKTQASRGMLARKACRTRRIRKSARQRNLPFSRMRCGTWRSCCLNNYGTANSRRCVWNSVFAVRVS